MRFRARVVGTTRVDHDARVVVRQEHLRGVDFSGRELAQFTAIGSRFEACRFDNAAIESASFGAGRDVSEYSDCTFNGARIHFGPGGHARFVRCSFHDTDLNEWFCFAVELVACTFSGTLRRSVFNGTVLPRQRAIVKRDHNEFVDNDFSATDLIDVAFRTGIDLTRQRLPSGPQYIWLPHAAASLHRARAHLAGVDDRELRANATRLIKSLESDTAAGQHQLLLRPDNYRHLPRGVGDALFKLLRDDP